jgi:uncharacterized protein
MTHPAFTILIHSSKTMRPVEMQLALTTPSLIDMAQPLMSYVMTLSPAVIASSMHVSPTLAAKTKLTIDAWSDIATLQSPAVYSFVGDIYSGLRASELSDSDVAYAQDHVRILSGLYGVLRPLDQIVPYRLEPAYTFPDARYKNMYAYWGSRVAGTLPANGYIINTSSVEYMKLVLPFVDADRVVTPRFLTINPATGVPGFTAVHAKIARGAFARWLIMTRITDPSRFNEFDDLGYLYDAALSTPREPVFVCRQFGGIGLSVRLK